MDLLQTTRPSRRAAQLGLGAAILLLITCVTLIVNASVHAGSAYVPPTQTTHAVR
jgi:hypothetical protein